MSRLAKKPLSVGKAEVSVASGVLTVKGPKGTLTRGVHPSVGITVADGTLSVAPRERTRLARALTGTFVAHAKNMIQGVTTPFTKKLILEGVGYKAEVRGKELVLIVGFSHPVALAIPEGVTATVEKNLITITSIDVEALGQFAADVRSVKRPEPYLGKGIRYDDEVVRRKQGKKAA
jgi:large subunit ribosomal protein L6